MIEQFRPPFGSYEPDKGPGLTRWASDQIDAARISEEQSHCVVGSPECG